MDSNEKRKIIDEAIEEKRALLARYNIAQSLAEGYGSLPPDQFSQGDQADTLMDLLEEDLIDGTIKIHKEMAKKLRGEE